MANRVRAGLLALAVAVLSACGGGGGGGLNINVKVTSDDPKPPLTKATPVTVLDGYIQGAIVCVDKNKNSSCDTGETQAKTGADGKVTLDIPLDDVGKYPIVAYIPADAMDSDNPKSTVGKSYTMSAPADQSAIVSPLSTLVQHLVDKGGKTTAQANLQISTAVGDPRIDYIQSNNAQARMAAKMLAALLQDPSKLVMPSTTTDAQKRAAMMDAMLDVLPYIQAKAQELSASGSACASDVASTACQNAVNIALNSVMQTAAISAAESGGVTISSGGRSDNVSLSLSGTYSSALGSDYSVRVLDGTSDLGAATVTESNKTWTFTPSSDLNPGRHSFTAVVVRKSDSAKGTASSAYTIELGNKVIANSSSNVLDTITLTLSNIWSNVKSVVFDIPNSPSDSRITSDLADGQTSKTVNAPDSGFWSSITTAFKTVGNKVISVVFKDGADGTGNTLDTRSITVGVGQGSVTQKASISSIKDRATPTPSEIADGAATKDTQPVISGTVDVALDEYYEVAVYDNGIKLTGTLTYTNNKKDWRFTPSTALTQGLHAFTAGVIRFDGLEGTQSSPARQAIVLTTRPSFSPTTPNVLDTVTFSLSNLYSGISTVSWYLDDGMGGQSSTVTNGATSINTRYGRQGSKTVTVTYKNASNAALATDTLTVNVGQGRVDNNAAIAHLNVGRTSITSGQRTDSLKPQFIGGYVYEVGSDYSVHVLEGDSEVGIASTHDASRTWSFTPSRDLSPGERSFTAVVVRNSDGLKGSTSTPFLVKLGNTVDVNPGTNVLDTITLTLSNIWSNVKSVVFSFTGDTGDLVDAQKANQTVNAPASDTSPWSSITTAFKTLGNKVISVVFKDGTNGTGTTLDTRSVSVTVGRGSVTARASITNVQDDSSGTPVEVLGGSYTTDTTPLISGSIDTALGADMSQFYDVAVFDNGTALAGTVTYIDSVNKKDWRFTPRNPLSQTLHSLTAKVVRFDGLEGPASSPRALSIGSGNISYSPSNPKVGDLVTFTATGLRNDVSTVTWDFGDGGTLLTRAANGSSSVTHTYSVDRTMALTVTYKDRTARTIFADNLLVPVVDPNAVAPNLAISAVITGVKDLFTNSVIPNGGRKPGSGPFELTGTITPNIDANYRLEIYENSVRSYVIYDRKGTLSINPITGNFTYRLDQPESFNANYVVRVVDNRDPSKRSAWSLPYKVLFSPGLAVNNASVNAWDDVVLTVNGIRRPIAQELVRFAESNGDVADSAASSLKSVLAGYDGSTLTAINAYTTTGQKNILVEYKDSSGASLDIDGIAVTVNPAAAITQRATVTRLDSDVNAGKFVLNGTLTAPVGQFYSIKVFDNGASDPLPGVVSFDSARTGWTFTPDAILAPGTHVFKVLVVRGDGATGPEGSTPPTLTVPAPRFTKIANSGQALSNQAASWSDSGSETAGTQWNCVRDETSKLTWETKTNDSASLRFKNHSYTWYLSNKDGTGQPEGLETGGSCVGLPGGKCNTEAYVKAVNDAGLCGKTDWRIPSREELLALKNLGISKKRSRYFPNFETPSYWSIWNGNFSDVGFSAINNYNYNYYYDYGPDYGPYAVMLVRSDFLQTATIDRVSGPGGQVGKGTQTPDDSLLLEGSYSDLLGSNYQVVLYDGDTKLGAATANDSNKTWSYQVSGLSGGDHAFKAVVATVDGSALGNPSAVYGLSVVNKFNASKNNPTVFESINLWFSNLLNNISTVIWRFSDVAVDIVTTVANGTSEVLDYLFTTSGTKTINVEFKDASGQPAGTASKSFDVRLGTVTQMAQLTAVLDDAQNPAASLSSGAGTSNRRPLIKIQTDQALTNIYSVSLYNAATNTEILCDATSTDQKNWELRPKQDLPLGSYSLKAAVKRMDGVLGTLSGEWNIVIGTLENGLYKAAEVGANAHIGQVTLQGARVANAQTFEATIEPKPGTFSAPVKITWNLAALRSRSLIPTATIVKLPVFGLYANYANQVSVKLNFAGGTSETLRPLTITTPAGPTPMIGNITVKTARTAGSGSLGYDFIMSRGFAKGSPVILDTDGNIRWTYTYAADAVITGGISPESSVWLDNGFVIGDSESLNVVRMNLDGSTERLPVTQYREYLGATNFHHNMEKGKNGYLGLYDRTAGSGKEIIPPLTEVFGNYFYYTDPKVGSDITFTAAVDSDIMEFDPLSGRVQKTWDMKKILNDYMTSKGDTNTLMFNADSWFHANAAAYDASDDTIVVSSRQNFLIKLKYDTGEIVWIFGDPRKYWYTIPSLRAKALTLNAGGTYPLGQHAISIPSPGKIMVFNNGNISGNGHPVGVNETLPNPLRSVVSYYSVDSAAKTAQQDWQYAHPEALYSQVCSSAYTAPDQSLLVLYAIPQRMVGLDANKNIVFDFAYSDTRRCSAFNATPVPFGNLNFTR